MQVRATVISLTNASATVKLLALKIIDYKDVSFKAGQWVDFHAPDVDKVGGFTIYSPPSRLLLNGLVELAIKNSDEDPAKWVHTKCKLGDDVSLKFGGEFFYDPQVPDLTGDAADCPGAVSDLLLVAGGIGITPIFSIIQQVADLRRMCRSCVGEEDTIIPGLPGKVVLLFSAKSDNELIFKKTLNSLHDEWGGFTVKYFVTGNTSEDTSAANGAEGGTGTGIIKRRISKQDILEACKDLKDPRSYICGPPPMIDCIRSVLKTCDNIQDKNIYIEKWW